MQEGDRAGIAAHSAVDNVRALCCTAIVRGVPGVCAGGRADPGPPRWSVRPGKTVPAGRRPKVSGLSPLLTRAGLYRARVLP
jgi:hypothetical protein